MHYAAIIKFYFQKNDMKSLAAAQPDPGGGDGCGGGKSKPRRL
jgi:hypothetical protein